MSSQGGGAELGGGRGEEEVHSALVASFVMADSAEAASPTSKHQSGGT